MSDVSSYFSGEKIYGDDFDAARIGAWFDDEREGYANLGARDLDESAYEYHALNNFHGFRHLPHEGNFRRVLGFGSCFGGEFKPVAKRIEHLTIVDPSDAFVRSSVFGIPCNYVKPDETGTLPFGDGEFDLITCFGVLHHIPNVSHVIAELGRCLEVGGYALIREPIVSMGDWRHPRPGLTKRERGLPVKPFAKILETSGLEICRRGYCGFRLIPKLGDMVKVRVYNHAALVWIDAAVCRLLSWNAHYHATKPWHKFRPESAYFVVQKLS